MLEILPGDQVKFLGPFPPSSPLRWSVLFEFSFCGGKTRFTYAIAANKRANSHNFKIKNLNLLTITFLAVYLMNRGKSSYMNESSMRVNNTFR